MQKNPRSEILNEEQSAIAIPAYSYHFSIIPFHNLPDINVTFLFTSEFTKEIVDLVEFVTDHVVVIIAPRIPCDSPAFPVVCSGRRVACSRHGCHHSCSGGSRPPRGFFTLKII